MIPKVNFSLNNKITFVHFNRRISRLRGRHISGLVKVNILIIIFIVRSLIDDSLVYNRKISMCRAMINLPIY